MIAVRSHDTGAKSAAELITKLCEYGADGVQLVGYKTFERWAYEPGQLDAGFLEGLRDSLAAHGKKVILNGAYFNPVHSNAEKVEKSVRIFKEHLKFAPHTGCLTVGSETGSYNDDKWTYNPLNRTEKALGKVAEVFGELCGCAESAGARIGIEGAAGHVAYDVRTLNKLLKMLGGKNVDVIFDLYNFLDAENHAGYMKILEEGLDTFGGKILCFHMKDYVIEGGAVKQVVPGTGLFDYPKILQLIKRYDKNAVMVLEGTTGEKIASAAKYILETWREN